MANASLTPESINTFLSNCMDGDIASNVTASAVRDLLKIMTEGGYPPGTPEGNQALLRDLHAITVEMAGVYMAALNTAKHNAPLDLDAPTIDTPIGRAVHTLLPNPDMTLRALFTGGQ